jgi:hypothetical protein
VKIIAVYALGLGLTILALAIPGNQFFVLSLPGLVLCFVGLVLTVRS